MQQQQQDQTSQSPPLAGTPVIVDVFAEEVGGTVKFRHDWRFDGGPSKGGGAIELPRGTKRTPLHFQLRDQTNRGLRFVDNSDDAIWATIDQCPQGKDNGGQIEFPHPKSQPFLLRVADANRDPPCELHYRLWFVDQNGNPESYDPVIRNGGGGP